RACAVHRRGAPVLRVARDRGPRARALARRQQEGRDIDHWLALLQLSELTAESVGAWYCELLLYWGVLGFQTKCPSARAFLISAKVNPCRSSSATQAACAGAWRGQRAALPRRPAETVWYGGSTPCCFDHF